MIKASYQGRHSMSSTVLHGDAQIKKKAQNKTKPTPNLLPKEHLARFFWEFNISEKTGPSVEQKGGSVQEIMQNYCFTQILFSFGRQSPEFQRWFN